ncbi:MAG: radical SAM protein [Eggerthellaceae bacterium]|nr:radical SAM protein [Eggerthellaceae bacterium]
MVELLTEEAVRAIGNPAFKRYAHRYLAIERDFYKAIGEFGLGVSDEDEGFDELARHAVEKGAIAANGCKSFHVNWISSACIACRQGLGTETFLTSTKCPRNCYFCFNPNQDNYEHDLTHVHDIASELRKRLQGGARYTHLGITGGEPLLHFDEVISFLKVARLRQHDAHTRLYTSGAGLTPERTRELARAGLSEIRFSIKLDDDLRVLEDVYAKIEGCVGLIDSVMVEMPVMPDQVEQMKAVLRRLDGMGASGINLLELCFPFHNAHEFAKRGYLVKKRPYRVLYDYWYAGGLPIAGSERACFELLDFAVEEGLKLGVHYCSLENKLTGQVYQQNRFIPMERPACEMSPRDNFLKSAKAFGADRKRVKATLEALGETEFFENAENASLAFPVRRIADLAQSCPDVELAVCTSIVEMREGGPALRELTLGITTPASFDPEADW